MGARGTGGVDTAVYDTARQDEAHASGAYDYLSSIAMAPRLATVGAFARAFSATRVLDIGCGVGDVASHLDPGVGYVGVDLSETAVARARARHGARADTAFVATDFRTWTCPRPAPDCVVWAGIGGAWTSAGQAGDPREWAEIVAVARESLAPDGILILEMVRDHWDRLGPLLGDELRPVVGCDLDCIDSLGHPERAVRVLAPA